MTQSYNSYSLCSVHVTGNFCLKNVLCSPEVNFLKDSQKHLAIKNRCNILKKSRRNCRDIARNFKRNSSFQSLSAGLNQRLHDVFIWEQNPTTEHFFFCIIVRWQVNYFITFVKNKLRCLPLMEIIKLLSGGNKVVSTSFACPRWAEVVSAGVVTEWDSAEVRDGNVFVPFALAIAFPAAFGCLRRRAATQQAELLSSEVARHFLTFMCYRRGTCPREERLCWWHTTLRGRVSRWHRVQPF